MKTFRSLAALLFAAALVHPAPAQESSEIASLRAKAEKGNGIAQYNLGLAYVDGKGVARDPIEAFVWLSLARENGARGRALDNVAAALDKAARETARQRIAERKVALGMTPAAPAAVRTVTSGQTALADSKPAAPGAAAAAPTDGAEDPAVARLRRERDTYSARVGEIAADLFAVRTDRDRLAEQAAEIRKNAQAATLGLQEQLRAVTARTAELEGSNAALKTELERAQQELAALANAPKPAPGTAALEAKTRELAAALTELGAARQFGRQVEDTLNKVNDDRARVAASAAAELEAARQFGQQVEATLNKVNDQKAALEQQLAAVTQAKAAAEQALAAKPAAPSYPDLSGRVRELESALVAARNAAPAYPDLTERVRELEAQRSSDLSAMASAKVETARAKQEIAALTEAKEAAEKTLAAKPAYPDLRANVAAREQQLATLSAEAGRAKQEIVALTKAKEEINRELAETKNSLAQARQMLAAKPAAPSYPDLSGRVSELESALVAARNAAPAYPDLRGRVADLEKLVSARPAYPDLTGKVAELEASLAGARRQVDDTAKNLSGRVRQLEQEVASAKGQLGETATRLAAAQAENAQLRARPVAAAPSYPDLSGRVRELESALVAARNAAPAYPDLSTRVAELEAAVATSIQKFGAAEQARAEVARQFDDYKSATAAAQRERTTLLSNLRMLESDKAALRRQVEAATGESNQLRAQVATLKAQAAAPKVAAPSYPDLANRVGELENQLTRANAELSAAGPAKADLSARVAELEAALTAANQNASTQTAALVAERDAARSAQGELRESVARLEREKARLAAAASSGPAYPDLRDRVNQLEASLAAAQLAVAAKPAAPTYPDLSGRVAELESQLAKSNTALSAAGSAKAELSGRVAELEASLAAARNAAPAYPNLSGRVAELEARLAAQPATPGYPDLSSRVSELEAQMAKAKAGLSAEALAKAELETRLAAAEKSAMEKPATPAYPDLSGRVSELSSEVAQLRTDRERMQKLLADSGRQLADMSSEAARAKRDVVALTKAKEEATAANRSRPVAPPGYLERLRELEAALAQAQAAAAPATAPSYPDLSGRVSELETAAAESARRLIAAEAAQTALQQQLAEATTIAQNAARSAGEAAQLRRERDELSGKATDLAGEVAQLRTDRERMVKMLAEAGRQMRDTSADSARVKELESQLAALGSEASRAKQEIAALTLAKEAAQSQSGGLASERDNARLAQNELRDTIARLEREKAELASARPIPAYPDLSGRVGELETALAAAKQQLAAASAAPAPATATADTSGLEQKLADTESRLATALRGYATLQRERDTLAENAGKSAAAVTAERDALAGQVASLTSQVEQLRASAQSSSGSTQAELARLGEAVTTLQRTSAQSTREAAAARALAQQLQGANAVLAGENYQLKTMLARGSAPTAPVAAPTAAPAVRTHVVAAGDSLSRLSQRYYGTSGRWQEIYSANATLLGPNGVLRVGTELRIP